MASPMFDQAAGLRRMMQFRGLNIAALISGPPTPMLTAAKLGIAQALAGSGKEVLLLEEISLQPRQETSATPKANDGILLSPPTTIGLGVRHLSIINPRLIRKINPFQRINFINSLKKSESEIDTILVAVAQTPREALPSSLNFASNIGVLVSPEAESITSAYALIKKISQEQQKQHFSIILTGTANLGLASNIFSCLSKVAQQNGIASLRFAGLLPKMDSKPNDFLNIRAPLTATTLSSMEFKQSAKKIAEHISDHLECCSTLKTLSDLAEQLISPSISSSHHAYTDVHAYGPAR